MFMFPQKNLARKGLNQLTALKGLWRSSVGPLRRSVIALNAVISLDLYVLNTSMV